MKRLLMIITILICMGGIKLFSNTTTAIKDSLLKKLDTLPADSTRLNTLFELAALEPMSPSSLKYIDQMLEEAVHQGNKEFECFAMYAYIVYYFNHQDEENVSLWMNKLKAPALKNKFYHIYFPGKKAEIMMHIAKHKIEYSITEAMKMYELARKVNNTNGMSSAKLCLMTSYLMTMRNNEAIEAGLEAYRLLSPNASLIARGTVLQDIVLACSFIQDKRLIRFLDEYREILDKQFSSSQATDAKKNAFLLLESLYAGHYIHQNQLNKAHKYLKEMDKYFFSESYIPCRGLYYEVYSHYYKRTHEYKKALACADSAIHLLSNISENEGLNYEMNRANILADAGCLDEAISLYQSVLEKKNTFYRNLSAAQINEMYKMRDMNNLILQKEQHQTVIHYIIITLIAVALLILIPSTIRIYYVRKKLRKEEEECRAMSLIAEEANEVKSRFLANMSYNIRIPLNNVLGFSQLISTDANNIDSKQWETIAQIIQSNSTELIQLVNDVLDLSRLEAKKTKWQISKCEIIELCTDSIRMVHMKCGNKIQVKFQTNIESLPLKTDNARLAQVILSTLIYTDPCEEKREVCFSLQREAEKGTLVFRIVNSPLTDPKLQTQKTEIRHTINKLTIEYFGGTYVVEPDTAEGAALTFTYPLY